MMPKLLLLLVIVITIITNLEDVVHFFVFFALLSSTNCSNPHHQSPNIETRERLPPHQKTFFVLIFTATFFVFEIQCFRFIIYLCFFTSQQTKCIPKTNRIEHIHDPQKRRQMGYNAF